MATKTRLQWRTYCYQIGERRHDFVESSPQAAKREAKRQAVRDKVPIEAIKFIGEERAG